MCRVRGGKVPDVSPEQKAQDFRKLRGGGTKQGDHIGGRCQDPAQKRPCVHRDPSVLWM